MSFLKFKESTVPPSSKLQLCAIQGEGLWFWSNLINGIYINFNIVSTEAS